MNIRDYLQVFPLYIFAAAPSLALAAGTPLEAYNPASCMFWILEDAIPEDLNQQDSAFSGSPRLRDDLNQALQRARAQGSAPRLFMGKAFSNRKDLKPSDDQIHDVGCILMQPTPGSGKESKLQCHIEIDDRVNSYVFRKLPPQKKYELASYGCIGKCTDYPVPVIHEMPWEDGSTSRRQERASTEYAKRCLK
jgi:hypothetical protein